MEGMDALHEAVNQAFANYRKGLGELIVRTLTELAAKDPKSTYRYTSGMGIWYFTRKGLVTEDGETFEREDDDFQPEPAFSAIRRAEQDYENQVVPGGDFEIHGKKIIQHDLD